MKIFVEMESGEIVGEKKNLVKHTGLAAKPKRGAAGQSLLYINQTMFTRLT